MFVATKHVFCCDKSMLVARKLVASKMVLVATPANATRPPGLRKAVPVLRGVQDKETFLLSALLAGIVGWETDLTRASCTGTTSAMYMRCIHHASALPARNKCGQNNVHVVFIMHLPCLQGTSVVKTKTTYQISQ